PMGVDPTKSIENARKMKEIGVDAINIADGPRALARMSPISLAYLILDQVGIQPVVHYCCRDRNILGMQMDLIGAHALGLHNVLLITGDPPKMGNYPDATGVFDLDSIGLIHLVKGMNQGIDLSGRQLKGATSFVMGCGCNSASIDSELEVDRFKQKIKAGAEYAFSQPVYDIKNLEKFLDATKDTKNIPFFVGILPLTSLKFAEFLNEEVPGMEVPKSIIQRLGAAKSKDAQRDVGLEIAKESLEAAAGIDRINGAYIFPPFGCYSAVEKLLKVVK
ncbi:methylenetetrahydrofolate reductase, partial [Candidatus Parcubacteria bacterium]|nr:methylenetetrahydrofolate reductase [Candidatus Parcubacteria bacterium]